MFSKCIPEQSSYVESYMEYTRSEIFSLLCSKCSLQIVKVLFRLCRDVPLFTSIAAGLSAGSFTLLEDIGSLAGSPLTEKQTETGP